MNVFVLVMAILVMVFWGTSVILNKLGLKKIPETEVLFWASLAPLLGATLLMFLKGKFSFGDWRGIIWALFGGLSGFLGLYLFLILLKKYPASLITPIVALYPLITVILSIMLFGEKLAWYRFLGIAFALIGIFLLSK